MTKDTAIAALLDRIRSQVHTLEQMTGAARDEATNEQSRPENKYDTRALEASYLAAGQGRRLEDLRRLASWLATLDGPCDHVELGALVHLEDGTRARWVLLAPSGGPLARVDSHDVQLIGLDSPLGRALRGLEEGDAAEVLSPNGLREIEVVGVW